MGDTPKQPLLTQVTELLNGVYGSDRHRPTEKAPRGAQILGPLSKHARNLYMLRADLWDNLEHMFAAYHEHAAELKARCDESHNLAQGILAIVKAEGEDPEFRRLAKRVDELGTEVGAARPLATVVEVLYEQEVRAQFPQLGQRTFSVDFKWNVFCSQQGGIPIYAHDELAGLDVPHAIGNAMSGRHGPS